MAAKKKTKKKKLSPDEVARRAYTKDVRSVFRWGGFQRVPTLSDKQIVFLDVEGDIDDIFVFENIIVVLEYTTLKSNSISAHLKKKKILFDKILNNQEEFIEYLETNFSKFTEALNDNYHVSKYKVVIVYCSKNKLAENKKKSVPKIKYLDYSILKYFQSVTKAVYKSARFEIFDFLGLSFEEVGKSSGGEPKTDYEGSILPEAHSGFKKGYKIVSFYVDPESLLNRAYVLRKDGWKDENELYQRMISESKIKTVRRHLHQEKRVFVNNIIVTLPNETQIINKKGETIDFSKISKTTPIKLQLPDEFNSVGLIDGQHRVFAYHEGTLFEEEIAKLRKRQNLLVTGIIYPDNIPELQKTIFEAGLFLEINSTQTNVKSNLIQTISLLLDPFAPVSIAKKVINELNNTRPLFDKFEKHFYDKDKIKTASIVSYGLRPIVKFEGDDSFFSVWHNPKKEKLVNEKDEVLLESYVKFCAAEINKFLIAVKKVIPNERWTTNREIKGRVLTTTAINGFIICLRLILENNLLGETHFYEAKLKNLKTFPFHDYHSSQYGRMGRELAKKYFGIPIKG